MDALATVLYLAIGLFIAIGIFIAARELVCWYFKINERLEHQRRIERLLKKIRRDQQEDWLQTSNDSSPEEYEVGEPQY